LWEHLHVGKPQILRFLNMTVQTIGVTLHLLLGYRYCDIIFTIIYIYIVLLKLWKMQLNWHVFKINCCVIIFLFVFSSYVEIHYQHRKEEEEMLLLVNPFFTSSTTVCGFTRRQWRWCVRPVRCHYLRSFPRYS